MNRAAIIYVFQADGIAGIIGVGRSHVLGLDWVLAGTHPPGSAGFCSRY